MKEEFLYEIELPSHMITTLHPLPHPHGTPQMSKALGVGQHIIEKNLSVSKNSHISSKQIRFKSNSKLVQNNFERLSILNSFGLLY